MTDAYPVALSKGIAQWLDDQQFGLYRSAGQYLPADDKASLPPITRTGRPPLALMNVISLRTGQPIIDGPDQITPVMIFIRLKAGADALDALTDRLRRSLGALRHVAFGDIPIGLVEYRNGLTFEQDAQQRESANLTFHFRGRRP